MGYVSYSQFSIYSSCPFQWKLRYPDGHKVPSVSIHLLFGTALNDAIQYYLTEFYGKTEKAANELDLNEFLLKRMIEEFERYQEQQEGFTTKKELMRFFEDGVKILEWFKKKRGDYFFKKGYKLLGCELPLDYKIKENINFIGRIDCAIGHESTGTVKIYDFKKSMRGWDDETKKNPLKRGQLQLYKKFYSMQSGVDFDKISIEFLIFKQIIFENSEFPSKRIQKFSPPDSERSINKIYKEFEEFVNTVFDESGNYKADIEFEKRPSKYNCTYCPFKNNKEICPVGVSK
jgi:hypothetical protein